MKLNLAPYTWAELVAALNKTGIHSVSPRASLELMIMNNPDAQKHLGTLAIGSKVVILPDANGNIVNVGMEGQITGIFGMGDRMEYKISTRPNSVIYILPHRVSRKDV